jgi:thiol-disulfide isomerase/thioredoxin
MTLVAAVSLSSFFVLMPSLLVRAQTIGAPHQKVVSLTSTDFEQYLNDPVNPVWILKFYAPWCGHCKKMAPVLDDVMQSITSSYGDSTPATSSLAIGKIDCTVQKKLCQRYKISGYPTMRVAIDGIPSGSSSESTVINTGIYDYPGGRSKAEMIAFAEKMQQPAMQTIRDLKSIRDSSATRVVDTSTITKKGGKSDGEDDDIETVSFVVYQPSGASTSDFDTLTQIMSQVARKQRYLAKFYSLIPSASSKDKISSEDLQFLGLSQDQSYNSHTDPFVCRIEPNLPCTCLKGDSLLSKIVKVTPDVLFDYISSQSVPTVSKLGPKNFSKLIRRGRRLVVAVLPTETASPEDGASLTTVQKVKQTMAAFALSGPEEYRDLYHYGYFENGKQWDRFMKQFEIDTSDLPQIVVMDPPNQKFWHNKSYSVYDVNTLLQDVHNNVLPSQYVTGGKSGLEGWVHKLYLLILEYRPWSVVALVITFVFVAVAIAAVVSPGGELQTPFDPNLPPDERRRRADILAEQQRILRNIQQKLKSPVEPAAQSSAEPSSAPDSNQAEVVVDASTKKEQ